MKNEKQNPTRVTVTFQPSARAQKIIDVIDRANLNRSELLNELVEQFMPKLVKSRISGVEEALRELKQFAA